MSAPWNLNPFDFVIIALAILLLFRTRISEWFSGLLRGREDKHQLHSEVHGILLAVTAQAANTAQIRDALTQLVAVIGSHDENDVHVKQLVAMEGIKAELYNIRVNGEGIASRLAAFSKQETELKNITGALDRIEAYHAKTELHNTKTNVMAFQLAMTDWMKNQLDATKKLDERLFEFVNSTKRIMRALEGGVGGDDDSLIEAARDIRMRAADKGIDLTLEDALKRAREQANFR